MCISLLTQNKLPLFVSKWSLGNNLKIEHYIKLLIQTCIQYLLLNSQLYRKVILCVYVFSVLSSSNTSPFLFWIVYACVWQVSSKVRLVRVNIGSFYHMSFFLLHFGLTWKPSFVCWVLASFFFFCNITPRFKPWCKCYSISN